MKLWEGKLHGQLSPAAEGFSSSIAVDGAMLEEDITGSVAHARMLASCGVITQKDSKAITEGLFSILSDIRSGALEIDMSAEDVHTFVEAELTARIGEPGKRLHTARSRNDQVATDTRLYLLRRAKAVEEDLKALCAALISRARENLDTVMPGMTHLQPAQPVTFAHHLMAYVQMFLRDISRIEDWAKRTNECPLGSCALAGTTYPIDREMTAAELGFAAPCANTMDAVSDRDFAAELCFALSLVMTHISRLSEELILFCTPAFSYISISDGFTTGSSIMPQKRNPDIAELSRGKTGRVTGDLVAVLTMLKGLPLAYDRDMQEDKEPVMDSLDTVSACFAAVVPMVETLTVHKENMRAAAGRGFINATDCADWLVGRGIPFRDAYKLTEEAVARCMEKGVTLEKLPLSDYKEISPAFTEDIYDAVELTNCVSRRNTLGGPSRGAVEEQIEGAAKKLL